MPKMSKTKKTVSPRAVKTAQAAVEPRQFFPKTPARKTLAAVLIIAGIFILYGVFKLSISLFGGGANQAAPDPNPLVATIGQEEIYLDDVKAFAAEIPQLADLPLEAVYPRLLETMINSKVMLEAAEKTDLEASDAVQKDLKRAREQILSQAYLTRQLEASITAESMQALYDAEVASFVPEEEVRARHILLKTQKEAQDVAARLKDGADFSKLAREKSIDKNSQNGELGYFAKSMMIAEFGDPVFALPVGKVSAPIQTPFGWHVVIVDDKRMSAAPAFAAPQVQERLRQVLMERNLPRVIEQEWQKRNVVIKKTSLQD